MKDGRAGGREEEEGCQRRSMENLKEHTRVAGVTKRGDKEADELERLRLEAFGGKCMDPSLEVTEHADGSQPEVNQNWL